jgi:hypothetical protein
LPIANCQLPIGVSRQRGGKSALQPPDLEISTRGRYTKLAIGNWQSAMKIIGNRQCE